MHKEEYLFSFEYCVEFDNYYWFVAVQHAVLCRMPVDDAGIEIVAPIPGKTWDLAHQYFVAAENKGKLILAPKFAEEILVYDIKHNRFSAYDIKTSGIDANSFSGEGKDIKFRSAIAIDTVLWIMPQSCHEIVAFDMETYEVKCYREWYKQLEQYHWENCSLFTLAAGAGKQIYMSCQQTNAIVEFDTVTQAAELHFSGKPENRFMALTCTEKGIWLVDNREKALYLWDKEKIIYKTEISEISSIENGDVEKIIFTIYADEENVWLVPLLGSNFLRHNLKEKKTDILVKREDGQAFLGYSVDKKNGKVIFSSQSSNQIVIMDMQSGEMQSRFTWNKMPESAEETYFYMNSLWNAKFCLEETEEINCNSLIWNTKNTPEFEHGKNVPENDVGKQIWKQVMENDSL